MHDRSTLLAPPASNREEDKASLTRRRLLILSAGATVGAQLNSWMPSAEARANTEIHGISAFGDLKYPANFRHFDYVDPAAPKGGVFSQIGASRQLNQNFLTFNSLNGFILKGDGALGIEK